jgi:SET domain-containing protein
MSYEPIDIELIDKTKYIPEFLEISYSKNFEKAGLGIIAKKNIKKGIFLGNYKGEIHSNHTCRYKNCMYNFNTIKDNRIVNICGQDLNLSNWTRFMNSSLGNDEIENVTVISCDNNETYIKKNGEKVNLNGSIIFYAKKNIFIGEELLYDYGVNYNNILK